MDNSLEKARKIINEVDEQMAALFTERMRAAELVAAYKAEHGLKILDEMREAELIKRNCEFINDDGLKPYYVSFLKDLMAVSRSYQEKLISGMRVAFCGTEGAYAHIVTTKLFPTARKISYPDFKSAYHAVECGECDAVVLPIENSSNGEVGEVTDLTFSGSLYINGICELSISHDLLATPDSEMGDIKTVISHPQALGQCTKYIHEHSFNTIEFSNTALAARRVAELGDRTVAAIASGEAAEIFGLKVLDKNINESRSNTTRFAVFSRSENKHKDSEMGVHTILLFTVRNEAGALARAIDVIGKHGFNMRSLRSRPMKELLWQYYFYVEAEGNVNTDDGKKMMAELSKYCDRLKSVGTFTKTEI